MVKKGSFQLLLLLIPMATLHLNCALSWFLKSSTRYDL